MNSALGSNAQPENNALSRAMRRLDPIIPEFRYRPDVDGLRAIAVLVVVLFHAGVGVPGGYIGVDVFFVISGFLITSLIITDFQEGKFTLAHFWERRARRIIPAVATLVLATLIAGWFLMLPRDYAALGKSAACQSVFGANFYFWKTTLGGYFAVATEEMPLLHTWSLAVEEQFYLIVPLTFVALFRFPRLRTRRVLLVCFGAGVLVSFAASLYAVANYRVAAFYLLPTRAWELLLGSSLAILPPAWNTYSRATRETLSLLGLAGVLLPCVLYTGQTPFPGLSALPPCLGTALIIWANGLPSNDLVPTTLHRFLAFRPVVFIGLISYSLYLWHWPIFAFNRYYWAEEPLRLGHRAILVMLSIGVAILSWRFIESPFRRKVICGSRKSIFSFATTALATLLGLSIVISAFHGLPQRLPRTLQYALAANPKDDTLFSKNASAEEIAAGNLPRFGLHDSSGAASVLIWGDSYAMSALPAFDAVLKMKGLAGEQATHFATAPVLAYFHTNPWGGLGPSAPAYNEAVVAYIQKRRIRHVVLAAHWTLYTSNSTGSVEQALLPTVKKLVSLGSQPWVFLQVPRARCDVGKLLRQAPLSKLNDRQFCQPVTSWNGIASEDPSLLDLLTEAGAKIIDPRPAFLNSRKDYYLNALDGIVLYYDDGHLTKRGAEKVLIPILKKSFLPHLPSSGGPVESADLHTIPGLPSVTPGKTNLARAVHSPGGVKQ